VQRRPLSFIHSRCAARAFVLIDKTGDTVISRLT
jgi:hypothetical protein